MEEDKAIYTSKSYLDSLLEPYLEMLAKGLITEKIIEKAKDSQDPSREAFKLVGDVKEKVTKEALTKQDSESSVIKNFLAFRDITINVYTYLRNLNGNKVREMPLSTLIEEFEELGVSNLLKNQKTKRFKDIIDQGPKLIEDNIIKQDAIELFAGQNLNFPHLSNQLLEHYSKQKVIKFFSRHIIKENDSSRSDFFGFRALNNKKHKSDILFEIKHRKRVPLSFKENIFQCYESLSRYNKSSSKENYIVLIYFVDEITTNFDKDLYRFKKNLEELFPNYLDKIYFVPVSVANLHLIDESLGKINAEVAKTTLDSCKFFDQPQTITRERNEIIDARFLRSQEGTFSVWTKIKPCQDYFKKFMNNEYIVSHSTNYIPQGEYNYPNVFALSLTPNHFDTKKVMPTAISWRFWISNEESQSLELISAPLQNYNTEEWHNLIIRWNHNNSILEFLLNGRLVQSSATYIQHWPKDFSEKAFLGTWGSRNLKHYIKLPLFRIITSSQYLDDKWVKEELQQKP